ncbi:MAG: SDR family NAD(P)-dependent oxidoreductase, partial [Candidatus Brockarchaeota archaeon]|nr:SDR family NAD(P)-dependent oxidoreductase [Candidatus Brockarchaeota archaeon]
MPASEVLVTGGAGFIGSNLVERLVADGFSVTVLDDLSTGRMENLEGLRNRFEFIKGDVRDAKAVAKAVEGKEAVFHMAAIASVERSVRDPAGVEEVNVVGTLNLLKASAECGVGRFVYPSSCSVYGEAKKLPIDEDSPTRPISPYGVSKLAAENYCGVFHRLFGLGTVSLRFVNVYGPRQTRGPYSGVITVFAERLARNESLVIHGDGEQTRDFVNVKDAVESCILAMEREEAAGGIFNVASGKATSINELARMMASIAGVKVGEVHADERKGDIRHICG